MPRTSTTFKKGEGGKKKGSKHEKTKVKEALGLTGWQKIGEALEGELSTKLLEEMGKLKGKDFVMAMSIMTEYFKPKLNRTTLEGGANPLQVEHVVINVPEGRIHFPDNADGPSDE